MSEKQSIGQSMKTLDFDKSADKTVNPVKDKRTNMRNYGKKIISKVLSECDEVTKLHFEHQVQLYGLSKSISVFVGKMKYLLFFYFSRTTYLF